MKREIFDMAMDALEAAHESYLLALRSHSGNLMAFGLTPSEIEGPLGEIDKLESSLAELRQMLREAAAL